MERPPHRRLTTLTPVLAAAATLAVALVIDRTAAGRRGVAPVVVGVGERTPSDPTCALFEVG